MSGLLDVTRKCADDLASMSERERHYGRTGEEAWSVEYAQQEQATRTAMALTTIGLALACIVDAQLDESPDCVPKEEPPEGFREPWLAP